MRMHYYALLGAIFTALGACTNYPEDSAPATARVLKPRWDLTTIQQGHTNVHVIRYTQVMGTIDKNGFSYAEAGRAASGRSNLEARNEWIRIPEDYVDVDAETIRGGGATIRIYLLNLVVDRRYKIGYKVDELEGRQAETYEFKALATDDPGAPDTSSELSSSTTDIVPSSTDFESSTTETLETTSTEFPDQPSIIDTTFTETSTTEEGPSVTQTSTETETENSDGTFISSTSNTSPTNTGSGAPGTFHGSPESIWSLFLLLASMFV